MKPYRDDPRRWDYTMPNGALEDLGRGAKASANRFVLQGTHTQVAGFTRPLIDPETVDAEPEGWPVYRPSGT